MEPQTDKTFLLVGSHRAAHKLKQLLGPLDWYFTFERGGTFVLVPNERVADALKVTSVRRTKQNQPFMKCW